MVGLLYILFNMLYYLSNMTEKAQIYHSYESLGFLLIMDLHIIRKAEEKDSK